MKTVQIFGLKNSQSTRAAERFFKKRRVPVQFVDLKVKPMAPAEIGRFIDNATRHFCVCHLYVLTKS